MTILININIFNIIMELPYQLLSLYGKMEEVIFDNIKFYKIEGFSNYFVSKCGKILSSKFNKLKILKISE